MKTYTNITFNGLIVRKEPAIFVDCCFNGDLTVIKGDRFYICLIENASGSGAKFVGCLFDGVNSTKECSYWGGMDKLQGGGELYLMAFDTYLKQLGKTWN